VSESLQTLTGVGVWSGGLRRHSDAGEIAAAATELEELGYTSLFIPGGIGGDDVFAAIDNLLEATTSVPVITGILGVWQFGAAKVASIWSDVESRHPGRFHVGLGISHAPLVDRDTPGLYRKPFSKMVEYLDELDRGEPGIPQERRLIAALGPRMLELTRERAAGAHPYFVPVEHTRFARERLGPGRLLAVEQSVLLEIDPTVAREVARQHMAVYLGLPNYVNNLLRHGFQESDVTDGGSDRLVDAIVAWGDEDAIATRIAAHREAGADHVCVQVIGPEQQGLPLADWRRIAVALAE
jgi:probable F420-dependent oxidoreductase